MGQVMAEVTTLELLVSLASRRCFCHFRSLGNCGSTEVSDHGDHGGFSGLQSFKSSASDATSHPQKTWELDTNTHLTHTEQCQDMAGHGRTWQDMAGHGRTW